MNHYSDTMSASYDPADNKLRLRSVSKLDPGTYGLVKVEGFIWAPKQQLFVAPAWTPSRADLLLELCGEIGDEDTSLVDRAAVRAERFEGYAENRKQDSAMAQAAMLDMVAGNQYSARHEEKYRSGFLETCEKGSIGGMLALDGSVGRSRLWESEISSASLESSKVGLGSQRESGAGEIGCIASLRQSSLLQSESPVFRGSESKFSGHGEQGKTSEESNSLSTERESSSCSNASGTNGEGREERSSKTKGSASPGDSEVEEDGFNTSKNSQYVQVIAKYGKKHSLPQKLETSPVIVAHHSEKHARRDAEKIQRNMDKAVAMWDQAEYWEQRAKGAVRSALYKETPAVRARRIHRLEAEMRVHERNMVAYRYCSRFWLGALELKSKADGHKVIWEVNYEHALGFTGHMDPTHMSFCFSLAQYPRELPASQYEGEEDLWSALGGSDGPSHAIITVEQAKALALGRCEYVLRMEDRWLEHYQHRLTYEKTILEAQGHGKLILPKSRPKQMPLCNYRQASIQVPAMYRLGELETYRQVEMTSDQYANIHPEYKGTRVVEHSHRVRVAVVGRGEHVAVFLTDSKVHPKPEAAEAPKREIVVPTPYVPKPKNEVVEALREQAKTGVKTVVAKCLFPTPPELAERMAKLLNIEPGMSVLEPSAGTGHLIQAVASVLDWREPALACLHVDAVEINYELHVLLEKKFPSVFVHRMDFMEARPPFCPDTEKGYDRIIMNPPFDHGACILHIKQAMRFMAKGGILVALCANGPRQEGDLKPLCDIWEELPDDTFASQGTSVRTALLRIKN